MWANFRIDVTWLFRTIVNDVVGAFRVSLVKWFTHTWYFVNIWSCVGRTITLFLPDWYLKVSVIFLVASRWIVNCKFCQDVLRVTKRFKMIDLAMRIEDNFSIISFKFFKLISSAHLILRYPKFSKSIRWPALWLC